MLVNNINSIVGDIFISSLSLPHDTLTELVRYCLWLLECSHETGRQYSIMFFGLAFPFRSILEIFDSNDGLRRLYNTICTLSIISDNGEVIPGSDWSILINTDPDWLAGQAGHPG